MTDDLRIPKALLDIENVVKMVTLLFPCTTRRHLPLLPGLMHPTQRTHIAQVFRENNLELRLKFFGEPLIKYLWSKIFIDDCPDVSTSHLRRIRSNTENGEMKFNRFWTDIKKMELKFNFKLLPEVARNYESTKVFSE